MIKPALAVGLGLLASSYVANATLVISPTLTIDADINGAPVGQYLIDFNGLALGGGPHTPIAYPGGTVTVSFNPDGKVVSGSSSTYAAPWLQSANMADPTKYLTSGRDATPFDEAGSARLTFSAPQNYVGLLWGSVDTYNYLRLYNGATLVGQISGTAVRTDAGIVLPGGQNQVANGTAYVNIFSDLAFNKVVAVSEGSYAFELDNVAVPEPTTVIAGALLLLPFGVSTIRMLRRKA